jgi:hypothetical protein
MTCFETLNLTIEAHMSIGHVDELEDENNIFGVGTPLRSFLKHLSLKSYICSASYPYLLLHVKILLIGGTTMKGSFQMLHFWPIKLLPL